MLKEILHSPMRSIAKEALCNMVRGLLTSDVYALSWCKLYCRVHDPGASPEPVRSQQTNEQTPYYHTNRNSSHAPEHNLQQQCRCPPSVTTQQRSQRLQALCCRGCKAVLASTLHARQILSTSPSYASYPNLARQVVA